LNFSNPNSINPLEKTLIPTGALLLVLGFGSPTQQYYHLFKANTQVNRPFGLQPENLNDGNSLKSPNKKDRNCGKMAGSRKTKSRKAVAGKNSRNSKPANSTDYSTQP
jgi:hypothetical protein